MSDALQIQGAGGMLQTSQLEASFDSLIRFSDKLLKSNLLPQSYKNKEQVAIVVMKGKELDLPPMTALWGMYPVGQNIGMYGWLMLALVRRSGLLESINLEEVEVPLNPPQGDIKTTIGWKCTTKRKGGYVMENTFTREDAKKLKLYDKQGSQYLTQEKNMLRWKAIAANLRLNFSDITTGMYLPDELDNDIPVETEFTTIESIPVAATDPMNDYNSAMDALNLASKKTSKQALIDWESTWMETIEKLPDNLKGSIKRALAGAKRKFEPIRMEVKDGVTKSSVGTTVASVDGGVAKQIDTPTSKLPLDEQGEKVPPAES